jgi:prostaglandin-E synthase 1
MEITQHPAFPTFAICAALLVLKMIGVGHYTGILRIRLGALLNPEDVEAFRSDKPAAQAEHPDVERGLRAHRNDLESTLPFLAIGLPYLLTNPRPALASGLFAVFTLLRFVFSVAYIKGLQPWRSASFLAGELCVLCMLAKLVWWGLVNL